MVAAGHQDGESLMAVVVIKRADHSDGDYHKGRAGLRGPRSTVTWGERAGGAEDEGKGGGRRGGCWLAGHDDDDAV
jgi:hypothetical protein